MGTFGCLERPGGLETGSRYEREAESEVENRSQDFQAFQIVLLSRHMTKSDPG